MPRTHGPNVIEMAAAPPTDALDEVVTFITSQQAHPDRRVTYVGTTSEGIAAELKGLEPPWASTLRLRREDGRISAVLIVEWDLELGRAWLVGPWVTGDGDAWAETAASLVDAALVDLPALVTTHEMAGDVANHRLAALARSLGWTASEPNHILVADRSVADAWPPDDAAFRAAAADDVGAIAALQDPEFPGTYASADKLVDGQLDGSRIVLVADDGGGGVAGYVAGAVHDDGEGFIDFLVVAPGARRAGLGRQLVTAITRQLIAGSPLGRVGLVVQDHRAAARALYERLGFTPDGTLVAYRSWMP